MNQTYLIKLRETHDDETVGFTVEQRAPSEALALYEVRKRYSRKAGFCIASIVERNCEAILIEGYGGDVIQIAA